MAVSKKHQPVGQRYQIGDRVYRKQANMGAKGSKNYNKRFGTITEVDSSTNAVGAVNSSIWLSGKDQKLVLPPNIYNIG